MNAPLKLRLDRSLVRDPRSPERTLYTRHLGAKKKTPSCCTPGVGVLGSQGYPMLSWQERAFMLAKRSLRLWTEGQTKWGASNWDYRLKERGSVPPAPKESLATGGRCG